MAIKVNAATLYNKVVYTTDLESLRKTKKVMDDLQKSFKENKPLASVFGKSSIQDAKRAGKEQAKAYTQTFQAEAKKAARGINSITNVGSRTGANARGRYSNFQPIDRGQFIQWQRRNSTFNRMASMEANRRVANTDAFLNERRMASFARGDEKKTDPAVAEKLLNKQALLEQRLSTMTGLTNAQRSKAIQQAARLNEEYLAQKISMDALNTDMKLMVNEYVQMNREQTKLNASIKKEEMLRRKTLDRQRVLSMKEEQREHKRRTDENYWNRRYAMGMIPGAAPFAFGAWGVGLASVAGAGYMAGNAVSSSVKRQHDLTEASRQSNLSRYQIQAMSQSAQEHGIDNFTVPKIADAVKDMQDKIGDFVNNAYINKKGQWAGGGGLTDSANVLKLTMDDVKKFQGDPVGMVNFIVNRGQQMKLSQEQITNLLESFGNDFSRLQYQFENDGKVLIETMQRLRDNGYTLTTAQTDQINKLYKMGVQIDLVTTSLQDHFALGLAETINQNGQLVDTLHRLNPAMELLGQLLGHVLNSLVNILDKIPGFGINSSVTQGGMTLNNPSASSWDRIKAYVLGGDASLLQANTLQRANTSLPTPTVDGLYDKSANMWNSQAGYQLPQPQIYISQPAAQVTVLPDPELGNIIQAKTAQAIGDEFRNMTLGMQATTTNANN